MITFTGSSRTGKLLLVAAGESNMKRLLLECGGKAPNIVFGDAPDLAAVADGIIARAFWNQGQVSRQARACSSRRTSRTTAGLVIERASVLHPGDPLKEQTTFGALVSNGTARRSWAISRAASAKARARFIRRARLPQSPRLLRSPRDLRRGFTWASDCSGRDLRPVLSFSPSGMTRSRAHRQRTIYGLSAILWTGMSGGRNRLSQSIDAGWIVVNATASRRVARDPASCDRRTQAIGYRGGRRRRRSEGVHA